MMRHVLIGVLFLVLTLVVMLFFNIENDNIQMTALQNAGHFFIFTILSFYFYLFFDAQLPRNRATSMLIASLLTGLGGLIEFLQSFVPGRSASWQDLILDIIGIVVGYLLFQLVRNSNIGRIWLILIIIPLSVLATYPLIKISIYQISKSPLPVIISFDDIFVESIISTNGSASAFVEISKFSPNSSRNRVLRMNFAELYYSGVIFHETAENWENSGLLCFEIQNPTGRSKKLVLRIHDKIHNNYFHDRYNKTLWVLPGNNTFSLPIADIRYLPESDRTNQQLDMKNIQEIQLFSLENEDYSLVLSDLRLVSTDSTCRNYR